MCNKKVHAVIEYIKNNNNFCFDVIEALESPEDILNYYGIYLIFSNEEMEIIQKELKKLAESFQTSEMVNLYEKEITSKQMRWLE